MTQERTTAEIIIYNTDGTEIATVPITSSSKRVVKLMESDYIQLDFVLSSAVYFPVGSYVNDEIFGKFYVTEEQMPSDDTATGGFKYELKLNSWFYVWNLKEFFLVTNGIRKEITWNLTNTLKEQMRQFMLNLQVLGFVSSDKDFLSSDTDLDSYVKIDTLTVPTASQALTMSYSGTGMVDALKSLADTWECEYWITGTEDSFVIHFGKCQDNSSTLILNVNDSTNTINVESATINRSSDTVADRIYAFGSTDNIPYSYRKNLELQVDKAMTVYVGKNVQTPKVVLMPNRKLTIDMFRDMDSATKESAEGSFTGEGTILRHTIDSGWASQIGKTVKSVFVGAKTVGSITLDKASYGLMSASANATSMISASGDDLDNRLINFSKGTTEQSSFTNYVMRVALYVIEHKSSYSDEFATSGTLSGSVLSHLADSYGTVKATKNATTFYSEIIKEGLQSLLIKIKDYCSLEANKTYDIVICYALGMEIDFSKYKNTYETGLQSFIISDLKADVDVSFTYTSIQDSFYALPIRYGDNFENKAYIILNPYGVEKESVIWSNSPYYSFAICKDNGVIKIAETEEWANDVGRKFRIDDEGAVDVPIAYYTNEYDNEASLARLGDRRLCLPEEQPTDVTFPDGWKLNTDKGYIYRDGYGDGENNAKYAREISIAFDDIYPNGKMMVKDVLFSDEQKVYDYDDGSESTVPWHQYHIQLTSAEGVTSIDNLKNTVNLPFSKKYILDGYELGIRFLVPNDAPSSFADKSSLKCKLAGMQFSVGFNKTYTSDGKQGIEHFGAYDYAIVRNSDFGALLPNDILKPNVGDPCCLINWNVNAIKSLGLVSDAEKRLLVRSLEYAQALSEGSLTFTCVMISSWLYHEQYLNLLDNGENQLVDGNGAILMARSGYYAYELPSIGQSVEIIHSALNGGSKQTRVLGLEVKLDKPYDSPKVTCGETDAYSRLKQLEKEMTKLSK